MYPQRQVDRIGELAPGLVAITPGLDEVRRLVHVDELRGQVHARVEVHEGPRVVSLTARTSSDHPPGSYWHTDARLEVRLQLHAPSGCSFDGQPSTWDLRDDELGEPFTSAISWVVGKLEPEVHRSSWFEEVEAGERSGRHRARLERICKLAASRAVEQCDRSARHLALAFAPPVRMLVYDALIEDWWRRVEQMVGVCPGLFILASVVPVGCREIAANIRQGTRLAPMVRRLLARFSVRNRHASALVRGAPCSISPGQLAAIVQDPDADINDAPASDEDRRVWYTWCAECTRVLDRLASESDRRRLGGFISRHATALEVLGASRGVNVSSRLEELIDWSVGSGAAVPTRRSSPVQVMRAIEAWHEALWHKVDLDPALPFPSGPSPRGPTGDVVATPITTVGQLFEEGRRMRHCVGSFADCALAGERSYFHAVVDNEHVTIAVANRADAGWHLVAVAGFANRRPSALAAILRWVATLRSGPDSPDAQDARAL